MVGACQQNSGIFLVRGGEAGDPRWQAAGLERDAGGAEAGTGRDADDQITGQAAGLERPGTGRDSGGGRGWDRARCRRPNHRGRRRENHRGRRRENQLKRKRSIISSSNSGFSKSFSLVMIRLLCSQNPVSW